MSTTDPTSPRTNGRDAGEGGLRPLGFVIVGVLLLVGLLCLRQATAGRSDAQGPAAGWLVWAGLCAWLAVGLVSGNLRAHRQRRLVREAEAAGGTLAEPPSPLLWPATVLGILWRTTLVLVPGLLLLWYSLDGGTETSDRCHTAGTSCLTGPGLWLPVAIILLVGGLVLAAFGARRAWRNARRRVQGLPPELPVITPQTATASYRKVDLAAVAPVPEPTSETATTIDRRLDRLAELGRLHEQGVLDDEELARLKAEVLADDGDAGPAPTG